MSTQLRQRTDPSLLTRLLGLALIVLGTAIWLRGGYIIPITRRDFTVPIPLDYLLLCVGLITLTLPLVFLHLLASVLRGSVKRSLLQYIRTAHQPESKLTPDASPATIAAFLADFVAHSNRRFAFSFLGAILFVLVILPFLIIDMLARSTFRRDSDRILHAVQNHRLDFSSADIFRQIILDTQPSLSTFPHDATATHRIHKTLALLFEPSVTDPEIFEAAVTKAYERELRPYVSSDTEVLNLGSVDLTTSSLESSTAAKTYASLLAFIANQQGDQGMHFGPYLQGRQLLRVAHNDPNQLTPATHNLLGVNYAGTLRCYDAYAAKFSAPQGIAAAISAALGEAQALPRLTLARLADDEYHHAVNTSASNMAQSRYLNNRADLIISLLHQAHIEHTIGNSDASNQSDSSFLAEHVAPPTTTDASTDPNRLQQIFTDLLASLDRAVALSPEAEVFFSRAQLYSVAGELTSCEQRGRFCWIAADRLSQLALADLKIARRLGLPRRFFSKEIAQRLYLQWLWSRVDLLAELAALGAPRER